MKKQIKNRLFINEYKTITSGEEKENRTYFFEKIVAGQKLDKTSLENIMRDRFAKTSPTTAEYSKGLANGFYEHRPMYNIITSQLVTPEEDTIELWFLGKTVGPTKGILYISQYTHTGIRINVGLSKYWISNAEIFHEIKRNEKGKWEYSNECYKFVRACGYDSVEEFMKRYNKSREYYMYILYENSITNEQR